MAWRQDTHCPSRKRAYRGFRDIKLDQDDWGVNAEALIEGLRRLDWPDRALETELMRGFEGYPDGTPPVTSFSPNHHGAIRHFKGLQSSIKSEVVLAWISQARKHPPTVRPAWTTWEAKKDYTFRVIWDAS